MNESSKMLNDKCKEFCILHKRSSSKEDLIRTGNNRKKKKELISHDNVNTVWKNKDCLLIIRMIKMVGYIEMDLYTCIFYH